MYIVKLTMHMTSTFFLVYIACTLVVHWSYIKMYIVILTMYIALYNVYYITIVHQMYIIRIYKVQYNVHCSAHCKVQNNYTLNVHLRCIESMM